MTMQRQDYWRVAHGILDARTELLGVISRDTALGEPERATATKFVKELSRAVAISLATGFQSVNNRFKVEQFLTMALGDGEGAIAMRHFKHNNTRR